MEKAKEPEKFCRLQLEYRIRDVVYVKEEQAEEAKKRIADWEKKGEFPEPLRTQSHTPKARIAALIWVIIIVMGILFNIGFSMFR